MPTKKPVFATLCLLIGLNLLRGWSVSTIAQDPKSASNDAADVAQESPASPAADATPPVEAGASRPPLASEQKNVAERFRRLETLLLRSAELEAGENPTRSALLQQAVQLSKQAELTELLADAASRLQEGQYSEAIEKQKLSRESLKRLLELLQSENREQRIREQRDEVRRWIEETDRLLRLQSSLRGRTEGGQETEQAAQDQEKLANKATDIAGELQSEHPTAENQASPVPTDTPHPDPNSPESKDSIPNAPNPEDSTPSDSKPSESKPSESKPSESKPSESKPSDSQPSDSKSSESQPSDSKSSESKPSDSKSSDSKSSDSKSSDSKPRDSEPSDSKPSDSKPSDSEPGDSKSNDSSDELSAPPPEPPQSPTERAKQKIEQAKEKMKEAEQELKKAEREGAIERQREAEDRLREAIEELEEILRQLREEEVERSLASLETRLRRMLEMQTRVLEETTRLREIAGDGAGRQVQITALGMFYLGDDHGFVCNAGGPESLDELKILAEGERALLLLREEGSSAAFPEAIEQLNLDIHSVAERLQSADVGPLTVVIEQEIVSSLEEMVEALVQVQKENREKQKQQQPGQQPPGEPGDQPLVDKLAELRLVRTLQVRINNRTNTLSKMLEDPTDPTGQAAEQDLTEQLQSLAQRQSSIQQVTRDIVVGKGE